MTDDGDANGTQDESTRHCVYRFYDAAGLLLYVGRSCRFGPRMSEHRRDRDWWHEVATIGVIHCPDQAASEALELRLIRELHPPYNVQNRKPAPEPSNVVAVDFGPKEDESIEPWCSLTDVSRHLGVSESWIRLQVDKGMPATKIGKVWRFKASLIDEWLLEQQA